MKPNARRIVSGTRPGRNDRPNEDYVAVVDGDYTTCAVLLDGAGGPAELPNGCEHGTPWYVERLGKATLDRMASRRFRRVPLPDILECAIADVSSEHVHTCNLKAPGTPSSTVIAVRTLAQGTHLEYLVLSDSTLVVDIDGDITALSDTRIEDVGADIRRRMNEHPTGTPEHQAARIELVTLQREARNRDGGFWVAATDPAAAHHALTGTVGASRARRVALLSDGAARYVDFGLGSHTDLLDALAAYDPDRLFDQVREAEDGDPHGQRWPRAKHRDDAAAIYIDLTGDT